MSTNSYSHQILLYPPAILFPILCHAHVNPGLVVVVHRTCGGHGAVPRRWWLRPGWRDTRAAWRRWWQPPTARLATRSTSTLTYSNPSPSYHGSTMVRLGRRGLILTKQYSHRLRNYHAITPSNLCNLTIFRCPMRDLI